MTLPFGEYGGVEISGPDDTLSYADGSIRVTFKVMTSDEHG
jgi:hypothetical protein